VGERVCKGKRERGPYPERGLTGDVTPMAPHQCAHVCQAHAFARDVLPSHPAEGLKDVGNVVLGNTPTVVPDRKHDGAGVLCRGKAIAPGRLGSR